MFRFAGFAGWESLYSFLPEKWQASYIAKRLLGSIYKGINCKETPLIICMPCGSYRVVGPGKVEACGKPPLPPGV